VCTSPLPIRATCPAQLTLLDFIIWIIFAEMQRSWSSSLCSLLHSAVTSSPVGPNIFLSTLFSNDLCRCPSLNVRDRGARAYKITGQIINLYVWIFICSDSKVEDKRFWAWL
jgi:hypothetical protein